MSESLHIRNLTIVTAPGFAHGDLPSMDFLPQLNLIYGPNASGKSTTARIIQALLWPDQSSPETFATADISTGASNTKVKLLGRSQSCEPEPLPYVGDASCRSRYMLAQHELLDANEQGKDFAASILNEARGNIDLQQAAEALHYAAPPRARVSKDFRDARIAYNSARDKERETDRETNELAALTERVAAAMRARQEQQRLNAMLAYLTQQHQVKELHEKVIVFPDAMSRLLPDDEDKFDALLAAITQATNARATAEIEVDAEISTMAECHVDDAERQETDTTLLRAAEKRIASLEQRLEQLKRDISNTRERCEQAFRNIGGAPPATLTAPLSTEVVAELEQWAQRAAAHAGSSQALEDSLRWLDSTLPEEVTHSREQLQHASRLLQEWLATPDEIRGSFPWPQFVILCAGALAMISGVIATVQQAPIGWLAVIAGAMGLVFSLLAMRRPAAHATREQLAARYVSRSLPTPEQWADAPVQEKIHHVQKQIAEYEYYETATAKKREIAQRKLTIDDQGKTLAKERHAFLAQHGITPPVITAVGSATLWHYLTQLSSWQQHAAELAAGEEALKQTEKGLNCALQEANRCLSRYLPEPITNSEALRCANELLHSRLTDYRQAETRKQAAQRQVAQHAQTLAEKTHELTDLLKRLDMGDEPGQVRSLLSQLTPQLEEFHRAVQELTGAHAVLKEKQRNVAQQRDSDELFNLDEATIGYRLSEAERLAAELSPLSEQKGQCEQRIAAARKSNASEEARDQLELITTQLQRRLQDTLHAAVGHLLTGELERTVVDSSLPRVMQRARTRFAEFTAGRYELRIDSATQHFQAFDTRDAVARPLAQLSSGTRVQLLMAVRLGFVEEHEQGVQLPLIMDETLACSDPAREEAIINTALRICSEGRQLFYFTSKPDEAAAWETLAQEHNVALRRIDLPGLPAGQPLPSPRCRPEIPDGAALSHTDYGMLLGVPRLDIHDGLQSAHIWYIIENNAHLRALLEKEIVTCGQMHNLQLAPLVDALIGHDAGEKARRMISLLMQLQPRVLQGRGKPFNALALEQSGLLTTPAFREAITALAEDLDWNLKALLTQMLNGKVKGLRAKSIERFEDYCLEQGFLSEAEPLSDLELHAALLASARDAIDRGELIAQELERLSERLFASL